MSTTVIYDNHCLNHLVPEDFPEKPDRISQIQANLEAHSEELGIQITDSEEVSDALLVSSHTLKYIDTFNRNLTSRSRPVGEDLYQSKHSLKAALYAAGAGVKGVNLLLEARIDNLFRTVFCNVRPPGHHAEREKGMGFCFFNNIAVAANYALSKEGIQKVMIIDFDVHLGNGTREIFRNDDRFFFLSVHHATNRFYPVGFEDSGRGENFWLIPIEPGTQSRKAFLEGLEHAVETIMPQFRPDMIFISAGFDAVETDPLGGEMGLKPIDYETLTSHIRKTAENVGTPIGIVSMLEGGYDIEQGGLAQAAYHHVKGLSS